MNESMCRLHIFARRTARKYMTYITVASTGFIPLFLVGKYQLSKKLYQKKAPYCDILQRSCILRRFGGKGESLVSVESKVIVYSGLK